jgi:hypothetical protein
LWWRKSTTPCAGSQYLNRLLAVSACASSTRPQVSAAV